MSVTLESIVTKVRASRPIYNMKGERIDLSSQQRSVLRSMCTRGLHAKQIAAELGQAPRAISHIMQTISTSAGCKSHAQLGVWAAKQGLV